MSHDGKLQQAVQEELNWEPSVTAAHIGVTAHGGVITLTGHVGSYAEKHAAEVAAARVRGVRAVAEEIEVRLPIDSARSDEDIAAAAIERLSWDVSIPRDSVLVKVESGWLTLSGEVQWHFQRELAEQDVRRLTGVVGVSNQIVIKPRVNAEKISDDIMHALHRSWFFDPNTIQVHAVGGRVILSGTAKTPHERQVAAATAWASPGVSDVVNEVVVIG